METLKTYSSEEIISIFRDYKVYNIYTNPEEIVMHFWIKDYRLTGEIEFIENEYWVSYAIKYRMAGGNESFPTIEECKKFLDRIC